MRRALARRGHPYVSVGIGEALLSRRHPPVSGLLDDIINVGKKVIQGGAQAGQDAAGDEVERLLRGSELAPLLDKVEQAGHDGAVQAAKENAPWVIGMAVAAGLLGGAVASAAGGKVAGVIGAVGAAGSAFMIARGGQTTKKK